MLPGPEGVEVTQRGRGDGPSGGRLPLLADRGYGGKRVLDKPCQQHSLSGFWYASHTTVEYFEKTPNPCVSQCVVLGGTCED